MSYILFVDESGHDLRASPYAVLAGLAVEDSKVWDFICELHQLEVRFFGQRVTEGHLEIKGKSFLKRKTFRLAKQLPPIPEKECSLLAQECLLEGQKSKEECRKCIVTRKQLTALNQAKIAFAQEVMELCFTYQAKAFASIVDRCAPQPQGAHFLRKDYSYLFERFFYYLEDMPGRPQGLIVFDEIDKAKSHILLSQMDSYFKETAKGS